MTWAIITKNSRETQKVAELLARQLLKERPFSASKAVILALRGDLGAGKTTFIQGFAKGLGIKEKVLSPTFVILKRFSAKGGSPPKADAPREYASGGKIKYLYHLDCYRVDNPREILDLGFKEISADPKNIVIIEWAERIKKILPKSTIWLNFEWIDKDERKITINLSQKSKIKSQNYNSKVKSF